MKHARWKCAKILGTLTAAVLMVAGAGAGSAMAAAPAAGSTIPALPAPTSLSWLPSADTSDCADPELVQPFAGFGDSGWYALVPGQSPDSFDGGGWILGGGASVVTTTLQDGQTGPVLDLPSGSFAISPQMCVTSAYPIGKALVQNLGKAGGLTFGVGYEGTPVWTAEATTNLNLKTGTWGLSNPLDLNPFNTPGWQIVRFGFVATGKNSEYQLYDFYADPRMMR